MTIPRKHEIKIRVNKTRLRDSSDETV